MRVSAWRDTVAPTAVCSCSISLSIHCTLPTARYVSVRCSISSLITESTTFCSISVSGRDDADLGGNAQIRGQRCCDVVRKPIVPEVQCTQLLFRDSVGAPEVVDRDVVLAPVLVGREQHVEFVLRDEPRHDATRVRASSARNVARRRDSASDRS
jgi:hypothetical protein